MNLILQKLDLKNNLIFYHSVKIITVILSVQIRSAFWSWKYFWGATILETCVAGNWTILGLLESSYKNVTISWVMIGGPHDGLSLHKPILARAASSTQKGVTQLAKKRQMRSKCKWDKTSLSLSSLHQWCFTAATISGGGSYTTVHYSNCSHFSIMSKFLAHQKSWWMEVLNPAL